MGAGPRGGGATPALLKAPVDAVAVAPCHIAVRRATQVTGDMPATPPEPAHATRRQRQAERLTVRTARDPAGGAARHPGRADPMEVCTLEPGVRVGIYDRATRPGRSSLGGRRGHRDEGAEGARYHQPKSSAETHDGYRGGSSWTDQPLPSGSSKKTNEPHASFCTSLTSTPRSTSSARAASMSETTS
jgi:hypothetical protein